VVFAVALAATVLVLGYTLWHAADHLAGGDTHTAAQWAAISFAAGAPYIVGYGAWKGLSLSRAALVGERPSIDLGRIAPPLAVALAAVVLQALLSSGSYFTGDDWVHLVLAHQVVSSPHGLDLAYLDQVVFVHYAPGLRFVYWAIERFAPLDWPLGYGAVLALFGGSIWLLHLICARLFGQRRSNLVVLVLFSTSLVLLTAFLWFPEGLHKLPSTFLTLLAIHSYLRYREDRSPATLALSVAAMSFGLLFYVKVILVPLYLVLLRLLFLERRPANWLRVLWAERWTWLAFVPTAIVYLWNYRLNYAHYAGQKPPLALLFHYLGSAWFRVVVPALGGIQPQLDPRFLPLLGALVTQGILLGLVVLTVRRKRSAWRAWAFFAIVFVVNDVLVGLGRLESLGFNRTTADLRYQTELAWLLPLALAFAFFPADVADGSAPSRPRRFRLRVAGAAGLTCYLIAALVTAVIASDDWKTDKTDPPKAYVRTLRNDARRTVGVMGYERPRFVVRGEEGPWAQPRRLVPTLAPRVHFTAATSSPLAIRADGHIRPAHVHALGDPAHVLSAAGNMRVLGGTVSGRGENMCLATGARAGGVEYEPLPSPAGVDLYAALRFAVARGGARPAVVSAVAGVGAAPALAPTSFPLDRRTGSAVVDLGYWVRIRIPPQSKVCVRSLGVGWLET